MDRIFSVFPGMADRRERGSEYWVSSPHEKQPKISLIDSRLQVVAVFPCPLPGHYGIDFELFRDLSDISISAFRVIAEDHPY